MSLIIPANSLAGGGYAVDNSLRFNSGSSDYLNKSFGSAGDRTTWTLSFWTKRSSLSNTNQIFAKYTDGSNQDNFYFNTSNQFFWQVYNTGQTGRLITNSVYRDISAWYHVVCVWDTSNATAGDRMRLYINGEQVTSFVTEDQASLNADSNTNNSGTFTIGQDGNGFNYFNGYMSETYFIDGQALTPTDFGEFDEDSGVWKPIAYTGTYGTNGFFLEFQDSRCFRYR
jgi:hypothetical protein